jgi:hypothetical protein
MHLLTGGKEPKEKALAVKERSLNYNYDFVFLSPDER